jgi:PAS domain S-box-containing protein
MKTASRTIHALVVDDDPSFTELLAEMLEREDSRFEVHSATTVAEGIETLNSVPIDCVVSDYGISDSDGMAFLETIREEYGDIPFVLLTGEGDEEIASEAISAGVTDYIRKQQGTDQYSLLANRLTDAVEKRRARQALERRKRELEQLNERFQSFVRHSPDVIVVLSEERTIHYSSPAIEHVLGYDQDELVGEQIIEYVHPDDHSQVEAAFERLEEADDGTREIFECRIRGADGSWTWIESVASNRTGSVGVGYLVNAREITARKARERELEQKTERLEEFASIVSHDLQSPLMVADARLDLAMAESDSEHLPPIEDALERMDEIIEATLTLAREGEIVTETERVDLAEAADRWWETVATDDASLQIRPDRLVIEADRERLRRVVENLFSNAVEHGGSDVTVWIDTLESGKGFCLADDGPGIPEDQGDEIFDPGHSMSPDGTGFGLAIVEEIVEAHEWEIDVTESEAGGARFDITGIELASGKPT